MSKLEYDSGYFADFVEPGFDVLDFENPLLSTLQREITRKAVEREREHFELVADYTARGINRGQLIADLFFEADSEERLIKMYHAQTAVHDATKAGLGLDEIEEQAKKRAKELSEWQSADAQRFEDSIDETIPAHIRIVESAKLENMPVRRFLGRLGIRLPILK